MNKNISFLLLLLLQAISAFSNDGYTDSLLHVIKETKDSKQRISTQLKLAWYNYYAARDNTNCVAYANDAVLSAKKENLKQEEAEARYWHTFYTYAVQAPGGDQLLKEAVAFARQNKLNIIESKLLSLGGRFYENRDSALLMAKQALFIAEKYGSTMEQAIATTSIAGLITQNESDSAAQLFSVAVRLINSAPSSSEKYIAMRSVGRAWAPINQDSAKKYMRRALEICREGNLIQEEIQQMATLTFSQTAFFIRDSLDAFHERIRLLCRQQKMDSTLYMANYIQSSQDVGNNTAALRTGFQLVQICEASKDSAQLLQAYHGIGLSYEYSFDYRTAIVYLNKARQFKKWNEFMYLFALDDLALCHLKSGNTDSARYYAAAAYQAGAVYFKGEEAIFGGLLNDLGIIHSQLGDDSLALNYLQRSYRYYKQPGNYEAKNVALTTSALAKYFQKHNLQDSARYYGLIAIDVAKTGGFLENITTSSDALAEYYFKKNKPDSAYYYQSIGFDAYKQQYSVESSRDFQKLINDEQQRVDEVTKAQQLAAQKYSSNLKIYGLMALLTAAIIVALIVFRNNHQRKRSYDLLKKQKHEIDEQKLRLEQSIQTLNATQAQLIHSEKMASLGELTAGIAHEIQNPLNFVNNFSDVSKELIAEMKTELQAGNTSTATEIADDLVLNLDKINHHGKRADAIVKGMLQHSQASKGQTLATDINALADEYLRLSYHGLRAKDKNFNATLNTGFDKSIGTIDIVPQDIGRVILNLVNNAFYVVDEKKKSGIPGYNPEVSVRTKKDGNMVSIEVSDNGNGIPQNIIDKIFQPFFTTKPTGQGTGLGLSLSYDIVKAHGGELKVNSTQGNGSVFIIQLPSTK
jgi:signal transduction histidine kinase